jgi:hypothetical protein
MCGVKAKLESFFFYRNCFKIKKIKIGANKSGADVKISKNWLF